jgi:hypothetical protein
MRSQIYWLKLTTKVKEVPILRLTLEAREEVEDWEEEKERTGCCPNMRRLSTASEAIFLDSCNIKWQMITLD